MTKEEQLLQFIELAEEHGYRLPYGWDVYDCNVYLENGDYWLESNPNPSHAPDFCSIERIFFDPELSFIKALCKMKYGENQLVCSSCGENLNESVKTCGNFKYVPHSHTVTATTYHAKEFLFAPDRIEYLAKTFLEKEG